MMSSSTSTESPVPPGDSLRILLVEDVAADAELLERELRRAGVRCATQRVQRALALRRALEGAAVAETVRQRAEEELRRQKEFLSHAQAAAGIGSWEWDIAGDAVTWSDETYRIFGVDPAAGPITYERYLEL